MEWATESTAPRSSLVTVVAWIYIALTGLGSLVLALQNILFAVLPLDEMKVALDKAERDMALPSYLGWVFEHIRLLLVVFLVVTLVKLVCAIALLKRRNWARFVFVAIFALGIVWNIGGTILQEFVTPWIPTLPQGRHVPRDFQAMMAFMTIFMSAISAIFAIGFSILFAWLIRKLLSREIAAEFV